MRIYAVGDIHGQLDMLRAAHAMIAADRQITGDDQAPVIHLGDYTDRGPDSAGVLDYLIGGKAEEQPWRFLLGNHDRMMRLYLSDIPRRDPQLKAEFTWLHPRLGGMETLRSYDVKVGLTGIPLHLAARAAIPDAHKEFLFGLEVMVETDDLVFVHAGIRPGVALRKQSVEDLIWIRDEFRNDQQDHGKLIVHGHSPVDSPEHCGNRINLDTGAGYGKPLTTAVFEGRDCWILTGTGRKILLPPDSVDCG